MGAEASFDPIVNPANRPNKEIAEHTRMEWNTGHPDSAVEGWLEKDEVVGPEIALSGWSACCPLAICLRNESESLVEQTCVFWGRGGGLTRYFENILVFGSEYLFHDCRLFFRGGGFQHVRLFLVYGRTTHSTRKNVVHCCVILLRINF